jgi:hypothetical protein
MQYPPSEVNIINQEISLVKNKIIVSLMSISCEVLQLIKLHGTKSNMLLRDIMMGRIALCIHKSSESEGGSRKL